MAWQEDRKTPDESIDEINRKIAAIARRPNGAPFAINILSTLRFDAIRHQSPALTCPSGAEYLRAWAGVGWSLEALVLMSPDRGGARDFFGDFGAPTAWIYDSRKMPLSEMVGSVRNHFGWA
jgi:hypothetical protein